MPSLVVWARRTVPLLKAIATNVLRGEGIGRLRAVNTLFDADKIVQNFSNMNDAFQNITLERGDRPIAPLGEGPDMLMPPAFDAWVKARTATSVLVLQHGKIVHQSYYHGTKSDDRRISWSVAKSYLSVLFGILVDEGAISSINDPVVTYVPSLQGGAYDKASVRDVLQMSSGIIFDEDYLEYDSDINRMGRVLALGGKMDDFAAALTDTFAPAGQKWQYTSIDTHVIGMIARGATGRTITELMNEKLIGKLGLEQAPYYLTDGVGVEFVLGGLNITTRDYARFGQMVLQNGLWDGQQIVPAEWIAQSTTASANTVADEFGYGYQWWIPVGAKKGQEFMARGIYGQYIYIDKSTGVVIVSTGADRSFREDGVMDQNVAMFRKISSARLG